MENIIYQIYDTYAPTMERNKLEFYCCQTNTLNPTKPARELGIVIITEDGNQIDFGLEEREFDSLIDYLTNLRNYCKKFNEEAKPTE